jgi:hypothetical protein
MATKKDRSTAAAIRVTAEALEVQLRALCAEDDFAGGLAIVDDYPELTTRSLSEFEQDLRDWGFVYGLAFGLAVSANPEMAHEDAAKLAYVPARNVNARWGGEIEDPGEKRENAIRTLVQQFDEHSEAPVTPRQRKLHDAIVDLVQSARA